MIYSIRIKKIYRIGTKNHKIKIYRITIYRDRLENQDKKILVSNGHSGLELRQKLGLRFRNRIYKNIVTDDLWIRIKN